MQLKKLIFVLALVSISAFAQSPPWTGIIDPTRAVDWSLAGSPTYNSGARGGLAGRAASEEAVVKSGGRRNGGVGLGFKAGVEEPIIEAAQKNAVVNQNEQAQQRKAIFPWQVRATQARAQASEAQRNYWTTKAGQKDQKSLQTLYAEAVQNGDKEGQQKYADAITAIQKEPNPAQPNDLAIWRQQNPDAPIAQYWDTKEQLQHKYDKGFKPTDTKATPGEFGHIEAKKNDQLDKLRTQYKFDKDEKSKTFGQFVKKDPNDNVIASFTPDEWRNELQNVQNAYEGNIKAAGGTAEHYEYPANGQPQQAPPQPDPKKTQFKLTQSYSGHNYGRNSESEPWKRID
jgi:hypothetical protein